MAKQPKHETIIDVRPCEVFWHPKYNLARSHATYGKPKELQDSMVSRGWVDSLEGQFMIETLPDDEIAFAIQCLEDEWTSYKSAANQDSGKAFDLRVFEHYFVNNGKIIAPSFRGVSGNRRKSVFMPAMIERARAKDVGIDGLQTTLKAKFMVFGSERDRIEAQVLENTLKNIGFTAPEEVSHLVAAKRLVELGATQSDLRRTFKDGTGQKIWAFLLLNNKFQELDLYNRALLDPEHADHVKF